MPEQEGKMSVACLRYFKFELIIWTEKEKIASFSCFHRVYYIFHWILIHNLDIFLKLIISWYNISVYLTFNFFSTDNKSGLKCKSRLRKIMS